MRKPHIVNLERRNAKYDRWRTARAAPTENIRCEPTMYCRRTTARSSSLTISPMRYSESAIRSDPHQRDIPLTQGGALLEPVTLAEADSLMAVRQEKSSQSGTSGLPG
jgi:hypothetical protein